MGCCCSSGAEKRNRHGDYETDSETAKDAVLLRLHNDIEVRTAASGTESTISEPVECMRNLSMRIRQMHARLKSDTRPTDQDPATADAAPMSLAKCAEIQTWMRACVAEGLPQFNPVLHQSLGVGSSSQSTASAYPSRQATGGATSVECMSARNGADDPPAHHHARVGSGHVGPTDRATDRIPSWATAGALSAHPENELRSDTSVPERKSRASSPGGPGVAPS